jgi:Htaa
MPHHRAAIAAASIVASLAAVAPASAAPVALGEGATRLSLDRGTARALEALNVSVGATGRARAASGAISFPVSGGRLETRSGLGVVRHAGGLRLRSGRAEVRLSDFTIRIGARPAMTARVNGGRRVAVLVPEVRRARISREGLTVVVSHVPVRLSEAGAHALNAAFHVHAFRPGLRLGAATVRATPSELVFRGGQTKLALDPRTAEALGSLGIAPGLVGDAKANADGRLGFPIAGGSVDRKSLAGRIAHSGGISLTKGSTRVVLRDFSIDTRKATLSARVGEERVAILALDLSNPQVSAKGRIVTVGNVDATLTKAAADALNAAFGTQALSEGLPFGTATVVGRTA